jgi:hypothetical protein
VRIHFLGSKIAVARVQGFQGEDLSATNTILACAKHFAGYALRKQVEITILWTLVSQLCRILFFLLLKQQLMQVRTL